jgi:thiamine pyrophosphokinase
MSTKTAALFLNGDPPNALAMQHAMTHNPEFVICTDGAFYYMNDLLIKPNVVIGDMDSLTEPPTDLQLIYIEDQDTTDFEKALAYLCEQAFEKVVVLGSTGGQNDHFLGNLNAAYKFREQLDICFFDQSQYFFLAAKEQNLTTRVGKIISLIPFPNAKGITLKGFQYLLNNESLSIIDRVGTRNIASSNTPSIVFNSGSLWVFVEY